MDILEHYITKLEDLLNDPGNKNIKVIKLVNEILQSNETIYNEEIDDLLSSFALDIDYYEANPKARAEFKGYFGDEQLIKEIEPVLKKLKEFNKMDEFIKAAIEEARQGLKEGGIPIGSVLVKDGVIIGRGHNKRVQNNDPIRHAEIDCLMNAGRVGSYKGTVLYSTLMPCHLCTGAVIQFNIKKVVAGESKTFQGARELLESKGVEVIDLNLPECIEMMEDFINKNPELWNEDIGEL